MSELSSCPACGALPCDWVNDPHRPAPPAQPVGERRERILKILEPLCCDRIHGCEGVLGEDGYCPLGPIADALLSSDAVVLSGGLGGDQGSVGIAPAELPSPSLANEVCEPSSEALSLAVAIVRENLMKAAPWRFDAQGQAAVQWALQIVLTEAAGVTSATVVNDLKRLTATRGAPTAFAKEIGVSDELVLAILRGARRPGGRVLDALGYRCERRYWPIAPEDALQSASDTREASKPKARATEHKAPSPPTNRGE